MSWERAELHDDEPPDWEGELSTTLNALHQGQDGIPASWEHEWEWIQKGEYYPRSDNDREEVEIYYSDTESLLGAAEDNDTDKNTSIDEEPKPPGQQTRRSGRTWAPTHRNVGVSRTTLGLPRNADVGKYYTTAATSRPTTSRRRP